METKIIFSDLLNLGTDWQIDSVNYNNALQIVEITIKYIKEQGYCPQTGELCDIYDFRKERKWQHLPLWQLKTFIKCKVPRVKNSLGKVISLEVPWAETSKRYSFFLKNM